MSPKCEIRKSSTRCHPAGQNFCINLELFNFSSDFHLLFLQIYYHQNSEVERQETWVICLKVSSLTGFKETGHSWMYYRIFPSITRTLCIPRTQYFPVLTKLLYRYRAPYVYRAPENTWNRTTGCGQARILNCRNLFSRYTLL
jgi:hypothetical protein